MVATTTSLSLWGALWLPSSPPSYCPATRFTRQPAYEAARLIPQHSHSGCRGEYLPVSSQLTPATRQPAYEAARLIPQHFQARPVQPKLAFPGKLMLTDNFFR